MRVEGTFPFEGISKPSYLSSTVNPRLAAHFIALLTVFGGCDAGLRAAEAVVEFDAEIRPILEANCFGCHGSEKQKGKLRLDSPAAIRKGGDSGEPVFVAGKRTESRVFTLVSRIDPDEAMPPKEKDALSAEEIEKIGRWIDGGAVMAGDGEAAQVTTDHWSFQPVAGEARLGGVDAYLEEALTAKGLGFSPPADRRTLIRRLYLIMLGLPPTPEEVERFVGDRSPDAWAVLVERVLASPRYGERMARHWLDLVRFAESNGFETNRERPRAWRFRDYVIDSFNADKPYDQFVREHLAGDALGAALGTGFLVAGAYDIVKSPDINLTLTQRQDELADMINTTGTAFLGLTLGCARCHNHKFDPVTQKDYYSLQAVFAGVGYGEREIQDRRGEDAEREDRHVRESLAAITAELDGLREAADKSATGRGMRSAVNATRNVEEIDGVLAKFMRFTVNRTNASEPCIDELSVFAEDGSNVALGGMPKSSGDLQGYPIHKLKHINDGKFGNEWSWISDKKGSGWVQIEFVEAREVHRLEWARDREGKFEDRLAIDYVIELSMDGTTWQVAASSADREPFGGKGDPDAFIANLPEAEAVRARALSEEETAVRTRLEELERGQMAWVGNFTEPGATHRLYRGDPMAKREQVAPDALEVLGSLGLSMDAPERERRIALANWIASPENPLTARVAVNRLWQYVFGTGLVDTPSDFGANGRAPTHPELLDWLAVRFVAEGWSMKETFRILLNSEAFQQSSQPDEGAARVDVDSRYLWRFPPRRLEAEVIRDSMLAVAGTLDPTMGGPGFHLFDVDRENVVHYHAKQETGPAEWRRMIYLFKIRQEQDAVFGAFDCPDGNQVIPRRNRSTTPLQALNLFNSRFTMQQAGKLAERLGGGEDGIERAFLLLYGRPANEREIADAKGFIEEEGFQAFCRAMLNTNEFLFSF